MLLTIRIIQMKLLLFILIAVATLPAFAEKPNLQNLMAAELEGFSGAEVIVSRVQIPPNSSLPRHWHPGEEFAFVLSGRVKLWQKGKPDVVLVSGEVGKVPLKHVHTAITGEEGVDLLVFRIHETGQPERIAAE